MATSPTVRNILRIPVVYECKHYLIVNKPPNVYSQPPDKRRVSKSDPPYVVLPELKQEYGESAKEWRLVHRLDSVVTGGMLIAKDKRSSELFSRNLRHGGNKGYKLTRRYVALVNGVPGGLRCSPEFDKDHGVIVTETGTGERMVTKYVRVDSRCYILELVTGKKHQIRRHMAEVLGSPILNDTRYGAPPVMLGSPQGSPRVHLGGQIGLHSACVFTRVGMQERAHIIPVLYNNCIPLWPEEYVDRDGMFRRDITDILLQRDWGNEYSF